jgi:soluble lytic murein transglycosylase-like protein
LRGALAAFALIVAALAATAARADPPGRNLPPTLGRICDLIEVHATKANLSPHFFARLIWKESRFDPNAVSPAGAEGIAQFMPGTAAMRGLKDSFDIDQAIPASANYLGELKTSFGNLGLAAAAYNSGENRVSRWLNSGGFLPLETENYVLDIMGEPADNFSNAAYAGTVQPLDPKSSFRDACLKLPMLEPMVIAMATVNVKPWGIQVAGNFRRNVAVRQWQRLQGRYSALLADYEPVVSRMRSPLGRRGIYAVRIGVDDRANANKICQKLRSAGGACIVLRNR